MAVSPKRSRLRKRPKRPDLSNGQILQWADDYFAHHGRWPNINSGRITETIDDSWKRIDDSLRRGFRGLQKNSRLSLARLLEKFRRVRNSEYPPKLDIQQIIAWARSHRRRYGRWPQAHSGRVTQVSGETWLAIDMSLRKGRRGLAGSSSLAQILNDHGLARNLQQAPPLNVDQILQWADEFHRRHGHWPLKTSGCIGDTIETWFAVDAALRKNGRGLKCHTTLARFLAKHRGIRTRTAPRSFRPA